MSRHFSTQTIVGTLYVTTYRTKDRRYVTEIVESKGWRLLSRQEWSEPVDEIMAMARHQRTVNDIRAAQESVDG